MTDAPPDPSLPLASPKHEAFAQAKAAGLSSADSYRAAWGRPDDPDRIAPATARANGYRASKFSGVAERVIWLRRSSLADVVEAGEITREGLGDLMDVVTGALMECAQAVADTGSPHRQASVIRKLVTTHAGRVQRLRPQRRTAPEVVSLDLSPALDRLRVCTCP